MDIVKYLVIRGGTGDGWLPKELMLYASPKGPWNHLNTEACPGRQEPSPSNDTKISTAKRESGGLEVR